MMPRSTPLRPEHFFAMWKQTLRPGSRCVQNNFDAVWATMLTDTYAQLYRWNMNQQFLDGLEWYVDVKDKALKEILGLKAPLDGMAARLSYGLYFVNLLSLTEGVIEIVPTAKDKIHAAFDRLGGMSGRQNYGYLRELRNSLVHRGFDIVSAGILHGSRVYLLAPSEIFDKTGNRAYKRFSELVEEIITCCEQLIGPAVSDALDSIGYWDQEIDGPKTRADIEAALVAAEHMPEWARKGAREILADLDVAAFKVKQLKSFRDKLQPRDLRFAFGAD